MEYIILDLEATCWKEGVSRSEMETIEIGAVKLDANFNVISEFNRFIRPVVHPHLSDFCTRLTSIVQQDVDGATTFPDVFAEFVAWAHSDDYHWYSWGDFDREQLRRDVERHAMIEPPLIDLHLNLKTLHAERYNLDRPVGMVRALKSLEIELEGRHHRGIDDARNLVKIARIVLGPAP